MYGCMEAKRGLKCPPLLLSTYSSEIGPLPAPWALVFLAKLEARKPCSSLLSVLPHSLREVELQVSVGEPLPCHTDAGIPTPVLFIAHQALLTAKPSL